VSEFGDETIDVPAVAGSYVYEVRLPQAALAEIRTFRRFTAPPGFRFQQVAIALHRPGKMFAYVQAQVAPLTSMSEVSYPNREFLTLNLKP